MTDRGVSEVLGFVLVFGLVTATVVIVYATGFSGLYDVQQAEQLQNVERAFDVFDDNLGDIVHQDAPSRATEIKLAGGTIGFLDPVRMTVETNGTGCAGSCPELNQTSAITLDPIAYTDEGTKIVYSAGGVIRQDGPDSVMLSSPRWITGSDRSLIPMILTSAGEGSSSFGGRSTILVVALQQTRELQLAVESGSGRSLSVNVTIETTRIEAWERFFDRRGFTITRADADTGVVSAEFTTERIYLPRTVIELQLAT